MVVWEKNIIYVLMKNDYGWGKNTLLQWNKSKPSFVYISHSAGVLKTSKI